LRPRVCRRRPRCARADSAGFGASELASLHARIAKLKAAEEQAAAGEEANWRGGRCRQRSLAVLNDWVRRLALCGDQLVSGSYGGELTLIDTQTGAVLRTLAGSAAETVSLVSEEGLVACGDSAGDVCRWDAATGAGGVLGSGAPVTAVCLLEGVGDAAPGVLVGCTSGLLTLHTGGSPSRVLLRLPAAAPATSLSRTGRYLAVGCANGTVLLVTVEGALLSAPILSFAAHRGAVHCLQLLPSAADAPAALASGGADGVVRTWDLTNGGAPLLTLAAHAAPVTCLHAAAGRLVTGGRDGTLRCYDAAEGRLWWASGGRTAYLDGVAVAGPLVFATGTNNALTVLDFGARA
jgi:WD40 repeat protein